MPRPSTTPVAVSTVDVATAPARVPCALNRVERRERRGTSLISATPSSNSALILGSIIGVGIFNLPYSLASIGPISIVAMALTTLGALALALMFASLPRRLPADVPEKAI